MSQIVDDFTHILTKDKKDNTYKFALARFLLDYINSKKEDRKISYQQIAEAFLKYYWNQIIVYKIKQDFKDKKQPMIVKILNEKAGDRNEFYETFLKNKNNKALKKELIDDIFKYCLADVIPRFQRENNIYEHNAVLAKNGRRYNLPEKSERFIILKDEAVNEIRNHSKLLYETLILEWAKFLEKANFTPKLIRKIEHISDPRRNSLQKYKNILLENNDTCFYCGKKLTGNIHVDHFIPWSYVFEDELWNLVLSCDECNLKKGCSLPPRKYVSKLKELKNEGKKVDDMYENCKKAGFVVGMI